MQVAQQQNGETASAEMLVNLDEPILVTGASGFIGSKVVENLLRRGFTDLRCFVRPSSNTEKLEALIRPFRQGARVKVVEGNLLSRQDCLAATRDAMLVYHLAAGTGIDSFPDAFMNSAVTTRNLLEATLEWKCLKRFISVSSFTVYTNCNKPRRVL